MLKVLVVDDEPTIRREIILGVDWGKMDCVVAAEASNGLEGLEAAGRYDPNLIITSVRMPKMDGLEMVRCLRERGCRANVILLAAGKEADHGALLPGAVDCLPEPFRVQELIAAVERVRQREAKEEALPLTKGDKGKYVLQTMNYISRHYRDTDISITSIARAMGVSDGHLSHVFKRETSYTVISYLTRYRIHKAMELLRDGRYKVYQVAELVGYRDVAYFSSIFKKTAGFSPSEYQSRIGQSQKEHSAFPAEEPDCDK